MEERNMAHENIAKNNQAKIEACIRELLTLIGEDPDRPGLKETPKRVAKMYATIFEGINYTNDEIGTMFSKTFEGNDKNLVVGKDITMYSVCEHHIIPFFGKVHIGYIPRGKVLGLSKLSRIVKMCARRLQLQEKLGEDIAEAVMKACDCKDVAVIINNTKHLCVSMRGVEDDSFSTTTSCLKGEFRTDPQLRQELMELIK